MNGSGATQSCWMKFGGLAEDENLQQNISCEVCVIGSGIAGLSTAYHLLRKGRKVIIIDDGPLFGGETSRTTAHLTCAIDDRFTQIEKIHGPENARLTAQSHAAAIDRIEAIVRLEKIDCDFRRLDGYLFSPSQNIDELTAEMQAAHRAGLTDTEIVQNAPGRLYGSAALRFPNQGTIHPLKYLYAIREIIKRLGCKIYTNTHARYIHGGNGTVITSDDFSIKADAIVVATNVPVNDRFKIHSKQAPYRTYVIAVRIPTGSVADALYWDMLDPYHYVRLQHIGLQESESNTQYDLLIIGGEDHKTGQAHDFEERFEKLHHWAFSRFPMMQNIEFKWSGQVMETVDGLAYIGRNPGDTDNVFIATGDSGMGMTHGTIAGMLLADLITGKKNEWTALYDPARIHIKASAEYLKENINVAQHYADYLTARHVSSEKEIPLGSGAIVRSGLEYHAVYHDSDGSFHSMSAVCPHLKCMLNWNSLEKTWDCPCHGSRFDAYGHVLNGPANHDLLNVEAAVVK